MTGYDDDGFEAMMASKRSREPIKRLDLAEITRYSRSSSLKNVAIRIDYEDVDGVSSKRWVTIKSISKHRDSPPTMEAYCWVRRQNRTFRLDRITEVAGCDGELTDGQTFFEGFGLIDPVYIPSQTPAHLSYPEPDGNSAHPYYRGGDDDAKLAARLAREKKTATHRKRSSSYAGSTSSSAGSTPSGFEAFSKAIPDKTSPPKANSYGYNKRLIFSAIAVWIIIFGLIALLS